MDLSEIVYEFVVRCLPSKRWDEPDSNGVVGFALFDLAREKLAYEETHGKLTVDQTDAVFEMWHELAWNAGKLSPSVAKAEHMLAWRTAIVSAKVPKGQSPIIEKAWELTGSGDRPPEAYRYDVSAFQQLVSLCWNLDKLSNGQPWFLPSRIAAKLLDRDHRTVCSWLNLLVHDGILIRVAEGHAHKCPRYRYAGSP